jgi:hypothetical protein
MTRFATLALVLALVFAAGCGEDEKLKKIGEEAADTWKAVAAYTVEKKDQALAFFGRKMETLGEQWAKAKASGAEMSAEAKAALETKWQAVQAAYAKTKEASGDAWVKARDAFQAAYQAFKAELEK